MDIFFVVVGLLVCLYQAYRGYRLQWLQGNSHRNHWKTTTNIVLLLCLADAFFYFVCALLGCLSIALICHVVFNGPKLWELSVSAVALLAVLAFLGVTGITGQLPWIIQKWNPSSLTK